MVSSLNVGLQGYDAVLMPTFLPQCRVCWPTMRSACLLRRGKEGLRGNKQLQGDVCRPKNARSNGGVLWI